MSTELVLLGEILQLASDSGCNLDTFGEKVATSPKVTAEVVRVSNSALYGMEGKINRLERAVLILGMRTVADIASALLVAARMKNMDVGELRGDAIWTHSLEIGVCAQLVARSLGLPLESEAYPIRVRCSPSCWASFARASQTCTPTCRPTRPRNTC